VRLPRVELPAPLPPPRAQVLAVHHHEGQAEARVELLAPLAHHARRGRDDDAPKSLAQKEFAHDEGGLDGLSEAHVVGDEEVHARLAQRALQRLELVALDGDPRAVGRLKARGVGHREARPAQRVVPGREALGRVEAVVANGRLRGEHPRVGLGLPEHRRTLAGRVVLDAREGHKVLLAASLGARREDLLDDVPPRAHPHEHPYLRHLADQHPRSLTDA
jgi:hypothetical protein